MGPTTVWGSLCCPLSHRWLWQLLHPRECLVCPLQSKGLLGAHSWPLHSGPSQWTRQLLEIWKKTLKLNLFEASPNLLLHYLHWLSRFSCLRVCALLSLCWERLLGPYCGSSFICHLLGELFTHCLPFHFLFFVIFMVVNFSHRKWLSPLELLLSPLKSASNLFDSMNIWVLSSCLPLLNTWESLNKCFFK